MKGSYLSVTFHTTVFTVLLSAFAYVGLVWYFGTLPGEGGKAAHLTWKSDIIHDGTFSWPSEFVNLTFDHENVPVALFNDQELKQSILAKFVGAGGSGNCFPGKDWQCTIVGDPEPQQSAGELTVTEKSHIYVNDNNRPIVVYGDQYNADTGEAFIRLGFTEYVGDGSGNCFAENNWRCEVIDATPRMSVMALDTVIGKDRKPIILYFASTAPRGQFLKLATYKGNGAGNCSAGSNWDCEFIQIFNQGDVTYADISSVALALDAADVQTVAYSGFVVERNGTEKVVLRYLTPSGGGGDCGLERWHCETIVEQGDNQGDIIGADLINTVNGEPIISYMTNLFDEFGNYHRSPELNVARYVGEGGNCANSPAWMCEAIDMDATTNTYREDNSSLILTKDGQVAIGYVVDGWEREDHMGGIKYAEFVGGGRGNCFPGGNWDCETVISHLQDPQVENSWWSLYRMDLEKDNDGYLAFLYSEQVKDTINYLTTSPNISFSQSQQEDISGNRRRIEDIGAPQPVVGINFVVEGTTARLSWQDPPSFTLDHIEILRNYNPVPEAITGDAYTVIEKGQQMFTDSNLVLGNTYKYIVRSVNGYGSYVNSEEIAIEVKEEKIVEEEIKAEEIVAEEAVGGEEIAEVPPVEEEPEGALTVSSVYKAVGIPDVYYIASNEKRYVFPDEDVYKSWYRSFDAVQEVNVRELTFYPLAGIVTYRPGLQLIKIATEPKVYVLESGGVLRWIVNESIASELFGRTWSDRIVVVDAALFVHYRRGKDIASTTDYSIPEGVSEAGCGEGETALTGTCALVEEEGIPSEAPIVFAPTLEKEGIALVSVTPTSSVFLWLVRLLTIVLFIVIFSIKIYSKRTLSFPRRN